MEDILVLDGDLRRKQVLLGESKSNREGSRGTREAREIWLVDKEKIARSQASFA